MATYHPLAEELNREILGCNPILFELLSERGKAIYFPREGIIGQTAEAEDTSLNATIGIAVEDDGSPMRLPSIQKLLNLPPKNVYTYGATAGIPAVRKIWQEEIRRKNPSLKGEISLPVCVNGLTHGLSVAGYLFLDPKEELLLPDMFWENYDMIFEKCCGARLAPFRTFHPPSSASGGLRGASDHKLDLATLRSQLCDGKPRKRVLILNFPNNPSGYAPTLKEADEIVEILRESAEAGNRLVVILDDAYFGFIYEEGILRESLFARVATLSDRILAVKVDGASKEHFGWGLRVAFLTFGSKGITTEACHGFSEKATGVVRGSISNVSHLSQSLVYRACIAPEHAAEKQAAFAILRARYLRVKAILKDPRFGKFWTPLPFNAGYFLCLKLHPPLDANRIRRRLYLEYDTGVIAIGDLLRVAFSSVPEERIPELFENIAKACEEDGEGN